MQDRILIYFENLWINAESISRTIICHSYMCDRDLTETSKQGVAYWVAPPLLKNSQYCFVYITEQPTRDAELKVNVTKHDNIDNHSI